MFTIQIQKQADIFKQLLEFYLPKGGKVIDFTYGTGATWWPTKSQYEVTKTDAVPMEGQNVIKKDLLIDSYADLGLHNAGFFDPPYLIGRNSFDYPLNFKHGSHRAGLQGKRSWGNNGLSKYVNNLTIDVFNDRIKALNNAAAQTIEGGGLLVRQGHGPEAQGQADTPPHHDNAAAHELRAHRPCYLREAGSNYMGEQGAPPKPSRVLDDF